MGDLSEMRGLIVVITFIGVFVTITALMISESPTLFSGGTNGTSTIPAESTNPQKFLAWNSSYTLNLTGTPGTEHYFDLAGWHFVVEEKINIASENWLGMHTFDYWWIFINPFSFDTFDWFQNDTLVSEHPLHIKDLDTLYAANNSLIFDAMNSKTRANVRFLFNTTTYATVQDAYDAAELYMIFNVDFSDRNTSVNILNFIGNLFTWSLPGLDWRVQALIMIPLMVSTAYMVFIFVLRIVGAVFGGGGA